MTSDTITKVLKCWAIDGFAFKDSVRGHAEHIGLARSPRSSITDEELLSKALELRSNRADGF